MRSAGERVGKREKGGGERCGGWKRGPEEGRGRGPWMGAGLMGRRDGDEERGEMIQRPGSRAPNGRVSLMAHRWSFAPPVEGRG
jgi:hypothetical protein